MSFFVTIKAFLENVLPIILFSFKQRLFKPDLSLGSTSEVDFLHFYSSVLKLNVFRITGSQFLPYNFILDEPKKKRKYMGSNLNSFFSWAPLQVHDSQANRWLL